MALAKKHDAWLLADEVYRGAERTTDEITPSFYGRYEKVIAVGSMSKAYGLPGLRIGWAAAPPELLDQMWARHEYVTTLGHHALEQTRRGGSSPGNTDETAGSEPGGTFATAIRFFKSWMDQDPELFSSDTARRRQPSPSSSTTWRSTRPSLIRRLARGTECSHRAGRSLRPGSSCSHQLSGYRKTHLTTGLERIASVIKEARPC